MDDVAAAIAAMAAVTWQGESSFSLNPINNGNLNGTVDIGPFQINLTSANRASYLSKYPTVFGTNLAVGQKLNGNADANIAFGIDFIKYLYRRSGGDPNAIINGYMGPGNKNMPKREANYNQFGASLTSFFANTDCFQHQ
jgi:hypothetical protein